MRKFTFFVVFMVSFPVLSEPKINIEFNFYTIYPDYKKDLDPEMRERSPIVKEGIKYNGHTHWDVNWVFKWKETNGRCQINKVNTNLTVKYTLPRIPSDHTVSPEVRHSFDKYYESLFKHEQGHKDSGLFAARDIEKVLLSLGLFKDCNRLKTVANKIGEKIIKKYNRRDRAYDKQTNHGRFKQNSVDNFS
jgi:predicted secreted Zn-dependent protease